MDPALVVRVAVGRSGGTEVMIRDQAYGAIGAAINRGGLPSAPMEDHEEHFALDERIALWWTALALLDGPVINRPTRFGFLPMGEIARLTHHDGAIRTRARWISHDSAGTEWPKCRTNFHRVSSGVHVADPSRSLGGSPPGDILRATPFDPNAVRRVIVAGTAVFTPGWRPASDEDERLLAEIVGALREVGNYCVLTVEQSAGQWFSLACQFSPAPHDYRNIDDDVHDALAAYLRAGQ
jgi:hypothetical protein